MILYDAHLHTHYSTDSEESMEKIICDGISKGLHGITFTDHMDYHFPESYDWNLEEGKKPFQFCFEDYKEEISVLRGKYRDEIEIHTGVEIGLKSDAYEDNVKLSNHPTHPSRGKFNKSGTKFYLTDFGIQNPNLTLFGTADGN